MLPNRKNKRFALGALLFLALATGGPQALAEGQGLSEEARLSEPQNDQRPATRPVLADWKERYQTLTRTAASAMQSAKPENYASQLYLMERELVTIMKLAASSSNMKAVERTAVMDDARALLTQLQWNYVGLQTTMRDRVEAANPGSTGARLVARTKGRGAANVDLYAPSFKTDKRLPQEVRDARYQELAAKHAKAHPDTPVHESLTPRSLKTIGSGELLEWVAVDRVEWMDRTKHEDALRITRNAKHVVTSGGEDTLGAGSLKVIWHPDHHGVPEKALAVFASNWSGTFQPDIAALEGTILQRLEQLKFPRSRIILSATMPLEPKVYEVLLSMRKSEAKVKESVRRLVARADKISTSTAARWGAATSETPVAKVQRVGMKSAGQMLKAAPRPATPTSHQHAESQGPNSRIKAKQAKSVAPKARVRAAR